MSHRTIEYRDLGLIAYRDAWRYQELLREKRIKGECNDMFLFCEHPPVFTLGKQDCSADWKCALEEVVEKGIDVVQTDRGGRITYHGPGQVVGYLIFNIREMGFGVKDYVNAVEKVLMLALQDFGIEAIRDFANPGLWVGNDKIAAVGLSISHDVSMHGFALNYDPEMSHYQYIVPCGIKGKGVTSVKHILGKRAPTLELLKKSIQSASDKTFTNASLIT